MARLSLHRCVDTARAFLRPFAAPHSFTLAHRAWFVMTFLMGIAFCYAFPPMQTNDEDAHWLHMWGVAYGHVSCGGLKPAGAAALFGPIHLKEVRYTRGLWRWQYMRDAMQYATTDGMSSVDGTACGYQPLPYVLPGLIARGTAFGWWRGRLRPGSWLRAVFAARITNWVIVSLAVLMVCRLLPWFRNFTLFFYSIPEVLQQGMAINTDSFLFACAAALLLLLFAWQSRWATMVGLGFVVALMSATKIVYWPLCLVGVIVMQRQIVRYGWRKRDAAAAVVMLVLPYVLYLAWNDWRVRSSAVSSAPDLGSSLALQQISFLKAHPTRVFTILWNQFRDLFRDELMQGSWLSIFGAFGWSAFTMKRWGYYLLLVAGAAALGGDLLSGLRLREGEPRSRGTLIATAVATISVQGTVVAIIIGMYIYFSGAYMRQMFGETALGVQGRYYLVPIWISSAFIVYAVRRRSLLPRRFMHYPAVLTTLALFCCTLANVEAVRAILSEFYAYR